MLDNVSFTAPDGKVTGFLGPNGAGKSTTMRVLLGLIRPNSGTTLVDGVPYVKHASPMTSVGAVLAQNTRRKAGPHTHTCARSHIRTTSRNRASTK